jgi:hypothetical protein
METAGVYSKKAYDEYDDPYTLASATPKHYSPDRELPDISHHPSGIKKAAQGQSITKPGESTAKPPNALPQAYHLSKPISSHQVNSAAERPQDYGKRVPSRPISLLEEAPKISEDSEYEHQISEVGRLRCKCVIQ